MQKEKDDIEEKLYAYYQRRKQAPVPDYVEAAIRNAPIGKENKESIKHKKKKSFIGLNKVAAVIIGFMITFSGVAFSGNLKEVFNLIFTNSNQGLNKAVENGYVQNIDMDFVEDNGIKAKADYILMDDKNLNISFVYEYTGEEKDVDSIEIDEALITDEQDNVLAHISKTFDDKYENSIGKDINRISKREKIKEEIKESIHINAQDNIFPESEKVHIKINSICIKKQNESIIIKGNWDINISLHMKLRSRENIEYVAEKLESINDINVIVTDTTMNVEIELKELILKDMINLKMVLVKAEEVFCSNAIDYKVDTEKEGIVKLVTTFNITKYDAAEQYKLQVLVNDKEKINVEIHREV